MFKSLITEATTHFNYLDVMLDEIMGEFEKDIKQEIGGELVVLKNLDVMSDIKDKQYYYMNLLNGGDVFPYEEEVQKFATYILKKFTEKIPKNAVIPNWFTYSSDARQRYRNAISWNRATYNNPSKLYALILTSYLMELKLFIKDTLLRTKKYADVETSIDQLETYFGKLISKVHRKFH